jgi:biotin operon repressor
VNRTDRLYAFVEELRACALRRRSARELASLYEVSARTIERDIRALQEAGVPIYADAGRTGGYTLDKSLTLPPLNFSPAEAVALAVALPQVNVGPFEGAARSAVRKIVAAMSERNVIAARDLADRVRLLEPVAAPQSVPVPSVIEQAIVARRVLWICYLDRGGNLTERDVEPIVFMAGPSGWCLVGWLPRRARNPSGSAADREPAAAGDVLVPAARRHDRSPDDRPAGRARLPRRCRQGPGLGERGRRPGPRPARHGPPARPAEGTGPGTGRAAGQPEKKDGWAQRVLAEPGSGSPVRQ